ncbi:hypothetical protein [Brooklawnia cerclae]|uniref:Uncharacterized protein n=1 Tax=Brooklawnia cerclae TaxID=349934 RepID=A0ABX0SNX2_9ACTN|nr:hypothetical protein [Brooklawnia cerclae]NIH58461.1 hypothetical protein [Brooklawnia cerclae]
MTATATDDAHARDGSPAPNTSPASAPISIEVAADVAAQVSDAQQDATNALSAAAAASSRATAQYGTCATAAATAAKVVTLANFALFAGATISVLFSNANTAASATLNVNSTGAKAIRTPANSALAAGSPYNWAANQAVQFAYDGTYWRMLSASDTASLGGTAASTIATNINTSLANARVFVQVDAPSATKAGDVWFPVNADGNIIGMRYSTAAGTGSWSPYVIIAEDIMVAGEGGTIRLKDNTVTAGTVVASEALLQKILVRTLSAAEIDVVSLVAAILTGQIFKTSGYDSGTGVLIDDSGITAIDESGQLRLSGSGLTAGASGGAISVAILPNGQLTAVGGTFTGGILRFPQLNEWTTGYSEGFESGIGAWNNWAPAPTQSSAQKHAGSYSLELGQSTTNALASIRIAATAYPFIAQGRRIRLRFWLYVPSTLLATEMAYTIVSYSFSAAVGGSSIYGSRIVFMGSSGNPGPSGWQQVEVEIPATTFTPIDFLQIGVNTYIPGSYTGSRDMYLDEVELLTPNEGTVCQIATVDGFPGIQWYNADSELQGRIQIPDSGISGIALESGRASTSEPLQRVNVSADEANLVSVNTEANEVLASVAANKDGVVTIAGDTRIDLVAPGITATPEVVTSGILTAQSGWQVTQERYSAVAGVHHLNIVLTATSAVTFTANVGNLVGTLASAYIPNAALGEFTGSYKGQGANPVHGGASIDTANGTIWCSGRTVTDSISSGWKLGLSFTWIA